MRSFLKRTVFFLSLGAILGFSHISHAQDLGPQFAPKGQVRLAYTAAVNPINTTATSFVDLPNLAATVTIPKGKVADVVVLFSGMMNSPSALYVRSVIGAAEASPGPFQAFWGVNGGATTQSANFSGFLGEGTHTIKMQWRGLSGQQFMSIRNMTILLNLRKAS